MGVYTVLEPAEVAAFLESYGVGELLSLAPVGPGIENTTYVAEVAAEEGPARYVLTLFERDSFDQVAEVAGLTIELAGRGVPCPRPVALRGTATAVGQLREKPAVLVPFVQGRTVERPSASVLESLGRAVGQFHLTSADLPFPRPGPHIAAVLCPLARNLAGRIRVEQPELAELLLREADDQESVPEADLPSGFLHGDLFLDNVIFGEDADHPEVRALLDFQLAGRGPWLFDLAAVLLDAAWVGRSVCGDLTRAFLGAYRSVRPLGGDEFPHLPLYVRRAALRFLCLRIQRYNARAAAGQGKDPWELARRLEILRLSAQGAGRAP